MAESNEPTTRPANSAPQPTKPIRFALGEVRMTYRAMTAIDSAEAVLALSRHVRGDWGDVCEEDAVQNEFAVDNYCRIFSVYLSGKGTPFWIITEADRSATTVLLPDDY